MDAVEIARRKAADLHQSAITAGLSPFGLYALSCAVAKELDLDVEKAEAGAVILRGARATFIAPDALIVHESAGGEFDHAFLVAHEIGHAVLGDASGDEPQYAMDPLRPAEPSPVGFDRVVDYGRRQRREAQMDLFAREMLLPRESARRWHIEERLTASEIAERIGAPFEFVAQQLFDALLLPVQVPAPPEERRRPLNDLQRIAAQYPGRFFLLEAGPGTGKTQTVAGRISYLLSQEVDPRRILVLTFSNKAAAEMAERISQDDPAAAAAMWIGTFHAFGLDLIRRFATELNLPKDPRLLDRTEAVELLEQEFPIIPLRHYRDIVDPTRKIADILSAISRAKDEVVDPAGYAELGRSMLAKAQSEEEIVAAEKALEVASVYTRYEERKRLLHRVDFGDLVFLPAQLLATNSQVRELLQETYDHIIVDEYQDVNRSSIRLLTALGQRGTVWAVGDAKQSIYRFRGASSYNLERFDTIDFPGAMRGQLTQNYRSVPEVLKAVSACSAAMQAGGPTSGLEPTRSSLGYQPELRLLQDDVRQTVGLAEAIEGTRKEGYAYRDQAVLCTGNGRLSEIAANLEALGVPVLFLGSLFERPEVKDLLALLSILVDGRAMGLLRLAPWLGCELSLPEVAAIIEHLRTSDTNGPPWLIHPEKIPGLTPAAGASLQRLASLLAGFDEKDQPWVVLATVLLDRTRRAADLNASTRIADRAQGIALWQFLNFLRVQPAGQGLPIRRLLDRIRRLLRLSDDRDLRRLPAAASGLDAVRLMTVHGSKGLEFPVVHFAGLNKGTIPRSAVPPPCPPPDGMIEGGVGTSVEVFRAAHHIEQECLFYVGISRARDRLLLYASERNAGGAKRSVSAFVDWLGPTIVRRQLSPVGTLPAASDEQPITVRFDGVVRFTASRLALYERCGRRFFYSHLVHIGGVRASTPFAHMHDAVRTVVEGVIAGTLALDDDEALDLRLAEAFKANGLEGHGYEKEYLVIAKPMVTYLLSIRAGMAAEKPQPLVLRLGQEEVLVSPDDILVDAEGHRHFRSVRTGHYRASAMKDVAAAAFVQAVQAEKFVVGPELVFLADGRTETLELSSKELLGREEKLTAYMAEIRSGRFPTSPDAWTCPGCPAFFICGSVPPGELTVKM